MNVAEITVQAGDLSLAVKTWGDPSHPPVLALHGWQDNAATFDRLAPLFPDYYWVVPDLPGHGLSEHRGIAADYGIWQYGVEVMALANALSLDNFLLVGHSMGAGIGGLLAAIYHERIHKLVMLDVIGTMTTTAANSPAQLRESIDKRINHSLRKAGMYATRQAAIKARANNGVSEEGAALLGERGIAESEAGFYWRHDQRLSLRSMMSIGEEQMQVFLAAIQCPVLLITSAGAVQSETVIQERMAMVPRIEREHFQGGHHQHLDGDVDAIAGVMARFLENGAFPG